MAGSKSAKKSKRSSKGVMKKTTAKGAYARSRVQTMKKRRAPMVEAKRREVEDLVRGRLDGAPNIDPWLIDTLDERQFTNDYAHMYVDMQAVTSMQRGLEDYQMIGSSIFCKRITTKIELIPPKVVPITPHDLYLVHGWVVPPHKTASTVPARGAMTRDDLRIYVNSKIQDEFNSRTDYLKFTKKNRVGFEILGYKKIKATSRDGALNQNPSLTAVGEAEPDTGVDPTMNRITGETSASGPLSGWGTGRLESIHMKCEWLVDKKIQYAKGGVGDSPDPGTDIPRQENYYPNDQMIPFCIIFNPDHLALKAEAENRPYLPHADPPVSFAQEDFMYRMRTNTCMWYTDS